LGEIARQVFERLKSQEPGWNLQLTVNDLPTAYADHSLLYQVMMNILGNAIKFTSSRDIAVIEVGGRNEGSENIYYVKGNGNGFDERYVSNLFHPFQRLHLCAEYEGTGIGLAIVQRIIQKHGGRVWAEGKVNGGATFYFALPKYGEKVVSGAPSNRSLLSAMTGNLSLSQKLSLLRPFLGFFQLKRHIFTFQPENFSRLPYCRRSCETMGSQICSSGKPSGK